MRVSSATALLIGSMIMELVLVTPVAAAAGGDGEGVAVPLASTPGVPAPRLDFLKDFVGDARVLALGEPVHGAHEFVALRNALFEYLVEHLGFTAIAVESDFEDGVRIDDFVNGKGVLTAEMVAGVFSFAAPEAPRENRRLLEWMRSYNDKSATVRRIHFYGLDMMGRSLHSERPIPERPLIAALDYAASVDPDRIAPIRRQVTSALDAMSRGAYEELEGARAEVLVSAIERLRSTFEQHKQAWVARTSVLAHERGYRSVLNAQSFAADLQGKGWWRGCWVQGGHCNPNLRDARSADNLLWALRMEGAGARILVFQHNAHVRKAESQAAGGRKDFISLGQHLTAALGSAFVAVGGFFGQGDDVSIDARWYDGFPPGSLPSVEPSWFIDLRRFPGGAQGTPPWLRDTADQGGRRMNVSKAFDGVVYFSTISRWDIGGTQYP